jgi:hypothetical protein
LRLKWLARVYLSEYSYQEASSSERSEAPHEEKRGITERLSERLFDYVEFEGTNLAALSSLQRALRLGGAAVAWVLGRGESHLLIFPNQGNVKLRTLPVSERSVSRQVKDVSRALDSVDPRHERELASFSAAVACRLFDQLFGTDW